MNVQSCYSIGLYVLAQQVGIVLVYLFIYISKFQWTSYTSSLFPLQHVTFHKP
jgi:hypothetical protein